MYKTKRFYVMMIIMLTLLLTGCKSKKVFLPEFAATDPNWWKLKEFVLSLEYETVPVRQRIFREVILSSGLDRIHLILARSGEVDAVVWWDFWRIVLSENQRAQILDSIADGYSKYLDSLDKKGFLTPNSYYICVVSKLPVEGLSSLDFKYQR